jgi:ATP-binding cassette subfamily B multidrug efflux pump
MRIRWMAHRYLLRQSFGFYQDEFAGRIATKVMQTALGVRDAVMKMFDVLVYVSVYFLGALVLVAGFDPWVAVPFVAWLAAYISLLYRLLPKINKVAQEQADARSVMTGRIVDSYTNIMTVKLFAHAGREESYARESMEGFMDTVHRMMRLATRIEFSVEVLNALLLFGVGFVAIASWLNDATSVGGVAVAVGLVLRLHGMSHWIMWELSGLFESIGTAHDGMNTIAQVQAVTDVPTAPPLKVTEGAIQFDRVSFHYGKGSGVIEDFSLAIAPGERVGQNHADERIAAPFRPRGRAHTHRRAGYFEGTAGVAARADRCRNPGYIPLASIGARQHRLRARRSERRGSCECGATRQCP